MYQNFPLFRSHLDLAHGYWKQLIQKGDWVIDATCGNGHDSLILASLIEEGGVIGLDIQEIALQKTRQLLNTHLPEEKIPSIHLFQQSHLSFPSLAYQHPIRVVVYNLGYLPGGNKSLTTQTETTLPSIDAALQLLQPGGILSITCYPGHPEGAREETALISQLSHLKSSEWNVCHHTFSNRLAAPSLILVQKTVK